MGIAKFFGSALTLSLLCTAASAETLYRCGNTYQDRACDSSQTGKAIGSTSSGQKTPQLSTDPECARRGEQAQKISWQRESGKTREDLLGDTHNNGFSPDIIAAVYLRRGSALEIRAAIESECMEAIKTGTLRPIRPAEQAGTSATPKPADADASNHDKDGLHKQLCSNIKDEINTLRAQQKHGLSGAEMEETRQRIRDLEKQRSTESCSIF